MKTSSTVVLRPKPRTPMVSDDLISSKVVLGPKIILDIVFKVSNLFIFSKFLF